jgi:hypothetical protein
MSRHIACSDVLKPCYRAEVLNTANAVRMISPTVNEVLTLPQCHFELFRHKQTSYSFTVQVMWRLEIDTEIQNRLEIHTYIQPGEWEAFGFSFTLQGYITLWTKSPSK